MPSAKSFVEEDMASLEEPHLLKFPENIPILDSDESQQFGKLLCSYLGLSFAVFLGFLPRNSISLLSVLQSENKDLSFKLMEAEEELRQLHCRMKEDSKANARVVEIFANHRHAWQQEEKRLCQQIDECNEEIAFLKAKVEDFERVEIELKGRIDDLKREVRDKDEMLKFMSKAATTHCEEESEMGCEKAGVSGVFEYDALEEIGSVYGQSNCGLSSAEYLHHPVNKFWPEKANLWQDMQLESLESHHHMKHFVSRRESPWKVDGEESNGVNSKMKLLEQELLDLEAICKGNSLKFAFQLQKQAKRYQTLSCKLEDLCHRMQDPCEASLLSSEFRTQRQTEFLLEAFRLQQNASETGQKLIALQSEMGKSRIEDDLEDGPTKLAVRRSHVSIRNNLKEIQRNLEIWLARIIGDVEGILARDTASRSGRDYYVSKYPFAQ